MDHPSFMEKALRLAQTALGKTAPNPAVGCIIAKNGIIVGQGTTQAGGVPHAEIIALDAAGKNAKEATMYVTLEPCCHQGKSPPCTDTIIQAGIKQVYIATLDPFSKVNGQGIARLKDAGIEVNIGICEPEALQLNEGFFSVIKKKRPFITLKLATSLDSKIATSSRKSQWITGEKARAYVHDLRGTHDAILVGIGTVLTDNPLLTCRSNTTSHPHLVRVVLDSWLRTPPTSKLVQTAEQSPCWIYSRKDGELGHATIISSPDPNHLTPQHIAEDLANRGITRLLIEGGSKVATSFLKAGLVDNLTWIRAPILIGNDGLDALGPLSVLELSQAPSFIRDHSFMLDNDSVEIYRMIKA